ncbi:cytochrome P450 [Mycena leptocephala]|nr:cytochrome P450 [Mycena leptocephala]
MIGKLSTSLVGTVGAYALYQVLKLIYDELTSPYRNLPGPKSTHWLFGNILDIIKDQNSGLEERWVQEYGRTMKFHGFFGQSSLYTTDAKAIQHFLSHTDIYQKSDASRFGLGRIVGPGILVVEGEEHKHQWKIMNPAFGAPQVRELTSIFVDTSIQLRDIWVAQAASNGGVARVEILSWLSRATLDIIGLAGFNYRINALGTDDNDTPDELAEAFASLVNSETGFSLIRFLQLQFPVFRRIPTPRGNTFKAQETMTRVGMKLLAESKREIAEHGTFETGRGRDLLSLLVRANTAKDIPASQQLSDEDVLAQVPTFLVAGHETTSTALTWALFALTQNIAAQTRLRDELLGVSTDNPTMDELNELKYLDCVVRETLRVYAPVTNSSRVALRDDIVPFEKPFTDIHGVVHDTLRVRKGDDIAIPILALNRDFAIWGPDAMEFIPERWESSLAPTTNIPGIWGHMLTFLGGPRSCIGYRFSLVETKALLFTLLRALEFELAVPVEDIGKKATFIVQRPIVRSEREKGNQMPLLVRPVVR